MKILILAPIWERPNITKIWANALNKSITSDVTVLCILSKEDPEFAINKKIIVQAKFKYCYYENLPVSRKMNAGIEYSLQWQWDYIMNLGSDDIIHPALWALYKPYMDRKCPFFGLDKVYFYDTNSGKLGLSLPYVWGAGRMISREIIDNLRKKGEFLYKNDINRGLDCNSIENIQKILNINYKQVETNDFPYLVDIKSEVGLSDFHLLHRFYNLVDKDILLQTFPKIFTEWLK